MLSLWFCLIPLFLRERRCCSCFAASGYDNDKLATWFVVLEVGKNLGQGAAYAFLMHFAYFAAGTALASFSKGFGKLLEGFDHTMGTFIEYHGACFGFKVVNACLTSFLLRQKTLKAETVAWQAAAHQGGDKSCGARQGDYFHTSLYRFACYKESRIADSWCACIADNGNVLSSHQPFHHAGYGLVFVKFVI